MVACGGGGSDATSSTASGRTVVGTITGFGSIIMDNGVEYETDGISSCDVDDQDQDTGVLVVRKCEIEDEDEDNSVT